MVSPHKALDHNPQRTALGRGRPAMSENRQVPEDIVRAAEVCLESKSPQDISTKEIAALAGTRPAMIYYYYGSKDGLLAEILRRHVDAILKDFASMKEAIMHNTLNNPTRAMIKLLADSYNGRPTLCRILISELLRDDSPLTRFYLERWRSNARNMMVEAITDLSASGYYRRDVKIGGIVAMIRSVVFFPVVARGHLVQNGEPVERYLDDDWIDFIAEVFDSYLRPQR